MDQYLELARKKIYIFFFFVERLSLSQWLGAGGGGVGGRYGEVQREKERIPSSLLAQYGSRHWAPSPNPETMT